MRRNGRPDRQRPHAEHPQPLPGDPRDGRLPDVTPETARHLLDLTVEYSRVEERTVACKQFGLAYEGRSHDEIALEVANLLSRSGASGAS